MDIVHDDAGDRLAAGDGLRQLNLDGVDARNVVNDYADAAAVMQHAHLPLGVGESGGEDSEGAGAFFETIGQRVRLLVADEREFFGMQ
jgi:hypothetical protein